MSTGNLPQLMEWLLYNKQANVPSHRQFANL